ncbi:MAG: HprK-related kinase A [Halioglobus sp.]
MQLHHLHSGDLQDTLARGELRIRVGPYIYRMQSNLKPVAQGLATLYADFPLADTGEFVDFDVALVQRGLRQKLNHRCEFLFDRQNPFETIATEQSYAFMEWGMNWCVSLHSNEYLKLHAAVVARNGRGVIMPGVPGAGKSTLCAALALQGWRVLSDEHALIPPESTDLVPLCRPVSLKNESIDAIRAFSNECVLGPTSSNTHKGVVAHMKADLCADSHAANLVPAYAMVFPQYDPQATQQLAPRAKTASFILAAYHSFNYSLMGEAGFDAMHHLLDNVHCYDLTYHDLNWAVDAMQQVLE